MNFKINQLNKLVLAIAILLLALVFVSAMARAANTITVDSAADAVADDGACTLREAITNANGNDQSGSIDCAAGSGSDTIVFAGSTDGVPFTLTSQLPAVNTAVIITGNGAANTIIQASDCNPVTLPGGCTPATDRVLEVGATGDLTLNSLTVRHGRCNGSCATSATNGGGIYTAGTLLLDGSAVSANEAGDSGNGGGIYSSGTLTIQNGSAIGGMGVGNRANGTSGGGNGKGGGIYNSGGSVTLDASAISANTAINPINGSAGGGLYNSSGGTLMIQHGSIIGGVGASNSARAGGGIYNFGGGVTIDASTVSANTAFGGAGLGGGIFQYGGALIIQNGSAIGGAGAGNTASGGAGGGIYNSLANGNVTINASTVSANTAGDGAGIYHYSGTLTIQNGSTIGGTGAGNTASGASSEGGGILIRSAATIDDSAVSANTANDGGGIYLQSGSVTVNASMFSANGAANYGGGIKNYGTITSLTNSLFSGNTASYGGGIFSYGTITAITNSVFSDNTAANFGGGILNGNILTTLANSTFSGNSATVDGGGLYNAGALTTLTNSAFSNNSAATAGGIDNSISIGPGTITNLSNTIVANNTGGNCSGTAPGTSTADFTDSAGCFGWTDNALVPGTDYDTTLADNGCVTPLPDGSCVKTHALLAGSALIDAAVSGTATDQRGFAAVGTRDVGPYEYAGVPPATPTNTPTVTATPSSTNWSGGRAIIGTGSCFGPYPSIFIGGPSTTIEGGVYSNGNAVFTGSSGGNLVVNGGADVVGSVTQNYATFSPALVTGASPLTPPTFWTMSDFAPGGPIASVAASFGQYYYFNGLANEWADFPGSGHPKPGVYYASSGITLNATDFSYLESDRLDQVTLASPGVIDLAMGNTTQQTFSAWLVPVGYDDDAGTSTLPAVFSAAGIQTCDNTSQAITATGNFNWAGAFYAPNGQISISSTSTGISNGALIGFTVPVSVSGMTISYDPAALPPVGPPATPTLTDIDKTSTAYVYMYETATAYGYQTSTAWANIYATGTAAPATATPIATLTPTMTTTPLPPPPNLLLNGGMELDANAPLLIPDNWTKNAYINTKVDKQDCANFHSGSCSFTIKGNGNTKKLTQKTVITLLKGTPFTFSLWVMTSGVPSSGPFAQVKLTYTDLTTKAVKLTIPAGTNNWTFFTASFTAGKKVKSIVVTLLYNKGSGFIWFDGVSLTTP